ncbi:MAG: GerMN domain-containing protein [Eubacterium sp.]|nr:GerMN domain-containing protein [Eubacterium sp.]
MKKIITIVLVFAMLLNITACSGGSDTSEGHTYAFYTVKEEKDGIEKNDYIMKNVYEDNVGVINELLSNYGNDMVENIQIHDGQLTIYFNEKYNDFKEKEEVLYRAAIVKTMCSIAEINYVEFYVEDKPLNVGGGAVGVMDEYTFLDSLGGENYRQEKYVNLYFSDLSGKEIREVNTAISYDLTLPIAKLLLQALINGPDKLTDANDSELKTTISPDTVVESLIIRDNVCYVDFSKEFEMLPEGVSSDVVIYSIVNTLCELPNINKVCFTIDGEQKNIYGDTKDFNRLFERNLDLVTNLGKG